MVPLVFYGKKKNEHNSMVMRGHFQKAFFHSVFEAEGNGKKMRLFGRLRKNSNDKIAVSDLGGNKRRYSRPFIGQKRDLFDAIIGFDDAKELFEMSIRADKPLHLLLIGPPASAKSLFMSSLTKLERSYYAVGSSFTKSGIFDYLFEYRPRYFIVDEIEIRNKRDQTSLFNLSGILTERKTWLLPGTQTNSIAVTTNKPYYTNALMRVDLKNS